ncbi:MAG: hypothetical protein WD512_01285, partial [Candidatus Paceibacterota bacterium]
KTTAATTTTTTATTTTTTTATTATTATATATAAATAAAATAVVPNNDRDKTTNKTIASIASDKNKISKDLLNMNDEEIKKDIAIISSQNLPNANRGPIITDEATEAMVRSLMCRGIIPDLDKSINLGQVSSILKPDLAEHILTDNVSELYSN